MGSAEEKAQEHLLRGMRKRADGELDNAIAEYNQAIQLDPALVDAYNNRGNAYAEKGDQVRAIEDFDKAIELKPDHVAAYFNRGLSYQLGGYPEKALEDYQEALKLDPPETLLSRLFLHLGILYATLDDEERALSHLTKAIELDPNNVIAYNDRGAVYEQKGRLLEAIADYRQVVRLLPDAPQSRQLEAFIRLVENLRSELRTRLSQHATNVESAVDDVWPIVARAVTGITLADPVLDPYVYLDRLTEEKLLEGARVVNLASVGLGTSEKRDEDAA